MYRWVRAPQPKFLRLEEALCECLLGNRRGRFRGAPTAIFPFKKYLPDIKLPYISIASLWSIIPLKSLTNGRLYSTINVIMLTSESYGEARIYNEYQVTFMCSLFDRNRYYCAHAFLILTFRFFKYK